MEGFSVPRASGATCSSPCLTAATGLDRLPGSSRTGRRAPVRIQLSLCRRTRGCSSSIVLLRRTSSKTPHDSSLITEKNAITEKPLPFCVLSFFLPNPWCPCARLFRWRRCRSRRRPPPCGRARAAPVPPPPRPPRRRRPRRRSARSSRRPGRPPRRPRGRAAG